MKENVIKATIAALATGMGLYFKALFLPVALLILVMAADYTTGMIKAWILKELHSRVGTVGIVKKVCYLLVVGCGVLVDWILQGTLL
ncbi:MAG: phage holin family protein [Clostridiales bacterium]|nr:phage holin family protein [Clostridiales bacterium]